MLFIALINTIITIHLSVNDALTNQPIPHVQVLCERHHEGAVSDENGNILLHLHPGTHRLKISHIAYEEQTLEIKIPATENPITIKMEPRILQMQGVQIEESSVAETDVPILDYKTIKEQIPFAEPDIFRALEMLPAITSASDFSSAPAIRGLSSNYTSIYLDEAPVLNPYHVGGLFSAFDYGMIGTAKVYPGVAPVQHGDYGGGMIRLLPRFVQKNETQIELGLISTRLRLLRSLNTNWQTNLAFRYFTPQIANKLMTSENYDYYFYDIYWTNQLRLFADLLVQTNVYYSNEILPNSISENRIFIEHAKKLPGYRNLIFSSSAKLRVFKLSLYYSVAPTEMKTNLNWSDNRMAKYGFKIYRTWSNSVTMLKTGFEYEKTKLDYNWHFNRSELEDILGYPPQYMFFDDAPSEYDAHFRYSRFAVFFEMNRQLFHWFDCSAGLRFEQYHDKWYPMPRLTVKQVWKDWQFTFGYGSVYQFAYVLKEKINSEMFNPFIIRFPAQDQPVVIQTASFEITPPTTHFSTVAYLREFEYIPVYNWNTANHVFSNGYSAGLELSYDRNILKGELQVNYSLSISRVALQKRWQISSQERTHQFKLSFKRSLGQHWKLGTQFQLASGYPYSEPTHWLPMYDTNTSDAAPLDFIPRFGEPNNKRFPVYHRLDVSLERDWFLWGGILTARLAILNLYNRKNRFYNAYRYEYYSDILGYERMEIREKPNFPILPTLYLVYNF